MDLSWLCLDADGPRRLRAFKGLWTNISVMAPHISEPAIAGGANIVRLKEARVL